MPEALHPAIAIAVLGVTGWLARWVLVAVERRLASLETRMRIVEVRQGAVVGVLSQQGHELEELAEVTDSQRILRIK